METKDRIQLLAQEYQKARMIKETDYNLRNEVDYVNSAIAFLSIFPTDLSEMKNLLVYKEDEVEYLLERRKLLIQYQDFSDSFFEEAVKLWEKFPISYVKHSAFCDYFVLENEDKKNIGNHLKYPEEIKKEIESIFTFGKGSMFNRNIVSELLYEFNKKNNCNFTGSFWKIEKEILEIEKKNKEGFFDGYKQFL